LRHINVSNNNNNNNNNNSKPVKTRQVERFRTTKVEPEKPKTSQQKTQFGF